MRKPAVAVLATFIISGATLGPEPDAYAQGIYDDGVAVVTTSTDQDTTYTAGDGLVLEGQTFGSATAGQLCLPGEAVTGVATNGDLVCSCFPGLADCTTGCFDLATSVDSCGQCDRACSAAASASGPCIGGACRPCSPTVQDCSDGSHGCFADIFNFGDSFCAEPAGLIGSGTQGDDCQFLNGCAIGYGCVLNNDPVTPTGLECARFCDPDDVSGPEGTPRCEAEAGAGFRCERATDFYSNVPAAASYVGFCVGPEFPASSSSRSRALVGWPFEVD